MTPGQPPPAAAGALTVHPVYARQAAGRPNIVVVMADDMRVDELRFAPRLRRLVARHGLTFRNSFSSYPLCCPARASFFTGQLPHNHGVLSHSDPWGYQRFDDSRTLATSLAEVGYNTGFIGKYLNGYGLHDSLVSGEPSWQYVPNGWTDWRAAFSDPDLPGVRGGTYYYFDTPYNVNGTLDNSHRGRYQSAVIGDFSRAMARRFARSRLPFFMSVNYVAPHHGWPRETDDPGTVRDRNGRRVTYKTPARPGWVEGRFNRLITRAAGLPRNGGPAEKDITDKPPSLRKWPEPTQRERRAMRAVTRQRAEAVFAMDVQIGRLIETLKRTGEWRRTVFMFTSDNGYFLGEHRRRFGKLLGHEPSLRVPFLVTGPGMRGRQGGRVRSDPITTVDVSATIVDLAGAEPPRLPDGMSKVPTMRRRDRGWRQPVLYEALHTPKGDAPGFGQRTAIGVRTARYSLLRYSDGSAELYDLVKDPLQNRNRWGAPAYADVRRALERVWWDLKDCAGQECRIVLPAPFVAGPDRTRKLTSAYWRGVNRVYGW
jgi:arylsulfatase A-like enzyme